MVTKCLVVLLSLCLAYVVFFPTNINKTTNALEGDGFRLVQVGDMPLFVRVYDPDNHVTGCYFDRVQARQIVCTNEEEATPHA